MVEKIVIIKHKLYSLKFGINSLIVLDENLSLNEQEMRKLRFFLAVKNNNVSFEESLELLEELQKTVDIDNLLSQVLEMSLGVHSSGSAIRVSPALSDQVEELYKKAVGELGIAPHIFYDMTPHEIALAYQGYIDKKVLEANLQMVANRKASEDNPTLISVDGGGVQLSTIAERNKTFESLGI